jgi:hypothetical protein
MESKANQTIRALAEENERIYGKVPSIEHRATYDAFISKGELYRTRTKMSLGDAMKACHAAFVTAIKKGCVKSQLEAAFKKGFESDLYG